MSVEEAVKAIMNKNHISYDFSLSNTDEVDIQVQHGDWKHDHVHIDNLMEKNGFVKLNEEVTFDDGSDVYSSIHHYKDILYYKEASER